MLSRKTTSSVDEQQKDHSRPDRKLNGDAPASYVTVFDRSFAGLK